MNTYDKPKDNNYSVIDLERENPHNIKTKKDKIQTRDVLPIIKWKTVLKRIETSIIHNELGIAYSEAKELFDTISNTISERWDLGLASLGFSKKFFNNLRLVSPPLPPLFHEFLKFYPKDEEKQINSVNLIKIVYLLYEILYSVGLKRPCSSSMMKDPKKIPQSIPIDINISKKDDVRVSTAKKPGNPSGTIDKNHDIWKILQSAILRFENRYQ